jgi:hypothetical protein
VDRPNKGSKKMQENQKKLTNTIRYLNVNKGITVLKQEIDILDRIIDIQCEIRASVIIREWEDFYRLMENLKIYNGEFESMELERARVFAMIFGHSALDHSENEETNLYAEAARMPDEQRHAITDLYRELKIRVLRVRHENSALLKNLNEARSFTENFLADVFPGRRGKLYTSKGTVVASDVRSMLLNKSL